MSSSVYLSRSSFFIDPFLFEDTKYVIEWRQQKLKGIISLVFIRYEQVSRETNESRLELMIIDDDCNDCVCF